MWSRSSAINSISSARTSAGSFRILMGSRRPFGDTTPNAKFRRPMPSLMAFFKRKEKAPEQPQRLDWKLMERGAVALYYKSSVLSADINWFKQQQYVVHELNATNWTTADAFHDDVKRVLGFPAHYSRNLMSWVDSVSEIDVPDEGGTLLVFRRYDAFAHAQPKLAQTILDSIEST